MFGGIIAKRWQTGAMFIRMVVEHMTPVHATSGAWDFDDLQWSGRCARATSIGGVGDPREEPSPGAGPTGYREIESRNRQPARRGGDELVSAGDLPAEVSAVRGLVAFNMWQWIDQKRGQFEPAGRQQGDRGGLAVHAMSSGRGDARRDFTVGPLRRILYMLRGAMRLEYLVGGGRNERSPRGGAVPGPRSSRIRSPTATWGRVSRFKRRP